MKLEFEVLKFTKEEDLKDFLLGIDYEYYPGVLDTVTLYSDLFIGDYIIRRGNYISVLSEEEFDASKIA